MNSSAAKTSTVDLATEQQVTLRTPRRRYGILAKVLFRTMDVLYGKKRTVSKFKVLEVIARVPYQTWEHVGYIAMTHRYIRPAFARRVFEFVQESRHQQDNEQWHLLMLEEMLQQQKVKEGFLRYRVIPQIIAFIYYQISWLLYVIRPGMSYRLNADFEDHAEHEYMAFVAENPRFENEAHLSVFKKDYGDYRSKADLFRRIGLDEREHKDDSVRRMAQPRYA